MATRRERKLSCTHPSMLRFLGDRCQSYIIGLAAGTVPSDLIFPGSREFLDAENIPSCVPLRFSRLSASGKLDFDMISPFIRR